MLGLALSEARSARGLENKFPKSELGRRSGALGRLSDGMLYDLAVVILMLHIDLLGL